LRQLEEWGIDLLPIRKVMFWRKNLSWKLMLLNGFVTVVVILLAGVSVKDFACVTVGQFDMIGEEASKEFNEKMQWYLIRASVFAAIAAALVHYIFIRKLLTPLRKLKESTFLLAKGEYPETILLKSEDEIGQLTSSFNHMTKALKQEEQHRKRLMNDISHELRTPLSNLNGYLEALSNGVIEGNRELYLSLLEESQFLTKLVEQLHELSTWEARSKTEEEKTKVDIQDFIQQGAQSFLWEFSKRGISLQVEAESCELLVHEQGIKQIITNLMGNALLYNTGHEVCIRGRREQGSYLISVTNIGETIPEHIQAQIFERFVKADPSRHRNHSRAGTGLGLSIVKEIAQQHGGQVGLESDGNLHTFWVTIPD